MPNILKVPISKDLSIDKILAIHKILFAIKVSRRFDNMFDAENSFYNKYCNIWSLDLRSRFLDSLRTDLEASKQLIVQAQNTHAAAFN